MSNLGDGCGFPGTWLGRTKLTERIREPTLGLPAVLVSSQSTVPHIYTNNSLLGTAKNPVTEKNCQKDFANINPKNG